MRQKPTNKLVCTSYVTKTDCKTLQRISLWTAMDTLDTVGKVSIGQSFWFAEILVLSCDLKSKKSTRAGEQNAMVPTDVSETWQIWTRKFADIDKWHLRHRWQNPKWKDQSKHAEVIIASIIHNLSTGHKVPSINPFQSRKQNKRLAAIFHHHSGPFMFNSHSLWANFKDLSKISVFEAILKIFRKSQFLSQFWVGGRLISLEQMLIIMVAGEVINLRTAKYILYTHRLYWAFIIFFTCHLLILQMRKLTRRHALANQFVLRIFCTVLGSMDSTWINHKFRDDLVDFRLIFMSIEPKMMYMTKRMSPEKKEHTLVIEKAPKNSQKRKWGKNFYFLNTHVRTSLFHA